LLGLGGLLFLFKNFEEEVKVAVQKMLKFFGDVYLYFTADDFTFAMFKEDLVNKFLPKIREISFKILDFLWGAIKGVATEWLFGTKGDLRIKQEAGSLKDNKSSLQDMAKGLKPGELDAAANDQLSDKFSQSKFSFKERSKLRKDKQAVLDAMQEISDQSEGRIQWTGFDFDMSNGVGNILKIQQTPISTILSALPIIDGEKQTSWDVLDGINLGKRGGITKGMTEDQVDEIEANLKKRSILVNSISMRDNNPDFANKTTTIPFKGTFVSKADRLSNDRALADLNEDKLELAELVKLNIGQIFAPDDESDTNILTNDGVSDGTKSLATVAQIAAKNSRDLMAEIVKEAAMVGNQPGAGGAPVMITNNTDQSSNQVVNHSMSGKPSNNTVQSNMMAYALGLQGSLR